MSLAKLNPLFHAGVNEREAAHLIRKHSHFLMDAVEKLPVDAQGNQYPGHIDVLDGPKKDCLYNAYFGSDKIRVFAAKV